MALKARLYIETALRKEKTFLKASFCSPPFKLADVTEDKSRNELRLMLRSSSPGMLDGDEYSLKIEVSDRCSLAIETQSYQRLFSMKNGAKQKLDVHVGSGASFTFLPHPLVPQEAAIFRGKNSLYLKEDSSLIWGEVVSCGRKLNGEVFKFSSYHSSTEIFINEKLAVKENILLAPSKMNIQGMGQLEGFSHQATLIFINHTIPVPHVSALLNDCLSRIPGIAFGVTSLAITGVVVRLTGGAAEQLFSLIKSLAQICEEVKNNSKIKSVSGGY